MEIVYSIEEAVHRSSNGESICWGVTKENRWDVFKICYYQTKYRAKDEFKCIHYQKGKDILYYWLKFISLISFGHYQVVYEGEQQ